VYALMCECVNGWKKGCAYVRKDVKLATDFRIFVNRGERRERRENSIINHGLH